MTQVDLHGVFESPSRTLALIQGLLEEKIMDRLDELKVRERMFDNAELKLGGFYSGSRTEQRGLFKSSGEGWRIPQRASFVSFRSQSDLSLHLFR